MHVRKLAALEWLLISPALLFFAALLTRYLSVLNPAQQIIDWYAHRMWALWILLLALPLTVLATGCAALRIQRRNTPRTIYATTAAAGIIVAIVVLHMLAN